MRKTYKLISATLIFMGIGVFWHQGRGYAADFFSMLRVPLIDESRQNNMKESMPFTKSPEDYEKEKRIAAMKGVSLFMERAKAHFDKTGQKLLGCLGGGTNVWDHYIPEFINIKDEVLRFTEFTVSSEESKRKLEEAGIKTVALDSIDSIDILIDGADEINKNGAGIKGGGGCIFVEKKAIRIAKEIWIGAESKKLVSELGKFWLPLDIEQTSLEDVKTELTKLGAKGFKVKQDPDTGEVFRPDNGPDRVILNADFSENMILDPSALAKDMEAMKEKGLILEHGICFTETKPDLLLIGVADPSERVLMFHPKVSKTPTVLIDLGKPFVAIKGIRETGSLKSL